MDIGAKVVKAETVTIPALYLSMGEQDQISQLVADGELLAATLMEEKQDPNEFDVAGCCGNDSESTIAYRFSFLSLLLFWLSTLPVRVGR